MKSGIQLIELERKRQVEKEGWTEEHDNQHTDGSLSLVAALYASPIPLFVINYNIGSVKWVDPWPWKTTINPPRGGNLIKVDVWDKRKEHSRIRRLEIAGALIAAEIDRLQAVE